MKPWYQQQKIAARAYDGQRMRSFKDMPQRRKTGSLKRNRVMNRSRKALAINHPLHSRTAAVVPRLWAQR
jgi:hypothetical protein